MFDYRLYFMHPDSGHIERFAEFSAPDDQGAIALAGEHVGDHPLELWNEHRKVRRFDAVAIGPLPTLQDLPFAEHDHQEEQPADAASIRALVRDAFAGAEHSSGTEEKIVDALREASALTLSLVALEDNDVVGDVAISPVAIRGAEGWHGLGPVAVSPREQGKGLPPR